MRDQSTLTSSHTDRAAIERHIVEQLLQLFALCKEHRIRLSDLYREAERIADPERG
jgi:hypothetical protein